ncbi:MAG: aliphatic sulfonate ABC transporter substrate-binding protein [Desulfobacterales bacterium]|jgi:taurine transport system substrate-binding protein
MKYVRCCLRQFILMVFAVAVAWSAWAEETPRQLVIGYQMVPNAELIAKELGWQEKELGLPIQWEAYKSGRHVVEAIAAGQVDIGLVGTSPCAAGIARGVPLEIVWIHDIIGDNEALVVRADSGIRRIGELAGKKVAVPFGSTTHYHLMVALKLNNLAAQDVSIVNLEPGDMPAAWKKNGIDAAFVWEPTLSDLHKDRGNVILTSRQLAERGFPTADLCVVREAFATRYPSLVVTYLRNLDRAVRLYRNDPDQAARAVAAQLGISAASASAQMAGLIMLTGEEQLSGKFVGDMQLTFGLYTLLKETADFLMQAQAIESSPPWPVFMRSVSATYAQKTIARKKATIAGPRPAGD